MADDSGIVERFTWVEQNCEPVLTVEDETLTGGEGQTPHERTGG